MRIRVCCKLCYHHRPVWAQSIVDCREIYCVNLDWIISAEKIFFFTGRAVTFIRNLTLRILPESRTRIMCGRMDITGTVYGTCMKWSAPTVCTDNIETCLAQPSAVDVRRVGYVTADRYRE